jgi:hypothetical protein
MRKPGFPGLQNRKSLLRLSTDDQKEEKAAAPTSPISGHQPAAADQLRRRARRGANPAAHI